MQGLFAHEYVPLCLRKFSAAWLPSGSWSLCKRAWRTSESCRLKVLSQHGHSKGR